MILFGAVILCAVGIHRGWTQSIALRRITNTSEEAININPSISGDGRIVAFESTEDLAAAGGTDHFRAIHANTGADPATFLQMGGTRAVTPAVSQDGSRIAFASRDDPLGSNPDGNSEIFLFDGSRLSQLTNTSPGGLRNRTTNGNFQPSISDDGRFIAFSSNRDVAGQNGDGNLEIFVFDSVSKGFTQLTNSNGITGFTDAKISGDGNFVAYIRDGDTLPGTTRDLIEQPRTGGAPTVLAASVVSLSMTYGRAISDDGTRVVYSSQTATNTTQVFLYDGRVGAGVRQITSLGARVTEVPLHPSISGDGTRISFATRRNVNGGSSDGSVELYLYDLPTATFSKITNAPASATVDVVSSLNDDGSVVAFNFPRVLSAAVANSELANDSEIYLSATQPRPGFGALTILNGASLGNEPATTKAVAPDSIAIARGALLANSIQQAQRLPNGAFPTNVGGTSVTVNGRLAQVFFVSPGQVNFLVPAQTETGSADVIVTNSEGFPSRGTVTILRSAPGVFTRSGDGAGEALALNSDSLQEAPFDPSDGKLRLTIFATGARNAAQLSVTIGGHTVTPELLLASPEMPGLDEIHFKVPAGLKGAGVVTVSAQGDGRDANPSNTRFAGGDILINEVLADPPGAAAVDLVGDANHDGVRSSSDDEFVELVNSTSHDIDISGYQLLGRSSGAAVDTLRHTFAAGTILAAQTAVVIFGGGAPNPSDPVFGGALVLKASTGGLSLSNTGGIVTLRDNSGAVANIFEYGGATGLSAGSNQSLTRSPDVTGAFTSHSMASGAAGRLFSPGTRVDGTPFLTIPIARIDLSPVSPAIDAGLKQQFIGRAFNAANQEVTGVIFFWQSSNPQVATIDQTGLANSSTAGATQITASGRGLHSAPDTLTVRPVQRVLTSVEVTPDPATIPATGAQQFTAKGLDQFGNEITGLNFTWESSSTNVAIVDQNGLAKGLAPGQSTIKAGTQNISGTARLNVTAPTLIVNEVLADPPAGNEGDANHDGVRDGAQDEFVELANATNSPLSISGWTLRTHSTTSANETVRHTFAAGTTVPGGNAIVVFGGGTFDAANPLFGCAQVLRTSSAGLSLTNGGLTVLIRDASGNLVTEFSYGGSTGLNGGNAQSLTRSPDVNGDFALHSTPAAASGRKFSPGLKLDGTPFGDCPGHPASVTLSPSSTSTGMGQSTQFTAQASDQFGRAMIGVPIIFASDNNTIATIDSTTPNPSTGVFTASARGHNPGTAHITASANDGVTTASSNQATLTVNGPALGINDVSANEGNDGPTAFTFRVSSTLPAPAGGITFDIATANGTATAAGGDYAARSLTNQTIPAGQSSYSFEVTVTGDTLVESNESFFVNISNVSANASIGDSQGAGIIQNDDTPLLVISQLYGGGGNAGAAFKNDFIEIFNRGATTVDLAGWSAQYLSATGTSNWSVTPLCPAGSCLIEPGRYFLVQEDQGSGGTQDLPAPDASGTIVMTTGAGKVAISSSVTALSGACPANSGILDIVGYGNTANCFEGQAPAGTPGNATADFRKGGGCVDTNDNGNDFFVAQPNPRNSAAPPGDCKPEITINDVTVTENNSGTVNATFTVNLAVTSAQTVTVDFTTADGTAVAPADYQSNSGTLTFNPGDLSKTITILVKGDTLDEVAENFFVNLSNASNAVILDSQGQGTINDNDPAPSIAISDTSVTEGDSGTATATFIVSLSAASGQTVTVNYATADNTATAGSDYQSASGLLTFNPGELSKTSAVTINGDTTFEPNESFFVNLSSATNASISDGQGAGTILNDDPAPPVATFSITDVSIAEGDGGTSIATFEVTLSQASDNVVTVDYATANGTATVAGSDYQSANGTLTFGIGETSKPIGVAINGDTLVEPDETFVVNLTNATGGATLGDHQGVGTIQNNDLADLVISQVYPGGGLSGAAFTNDFIEIFNRGTTTVDFSVMHYSVQFLSTTAATWAKTDLNSGTILPGRYFLIKETSGGANGAALPAADATGTLNLTSTTAGKVALVSGTTLLTGVCPGDDGTSPFNPPGAKTADFVGYGGTATTANQCYEGSGPAAFALGNNGAAGYRKAGGCSDTNNNAADFFTWTPSPRNSASPTNNCAGAAVPDLSINNVSVDEGNSGTVTATFTLALSAPVQGADVTFDIATADGSATATNNDFVAKTLASQFIPAGQSTYVFNVTVNGDVTIENDEAFLVNLTNVAGATLTGGQGQGTIINDDFPTLSVNDVSAPEGDAGTKTLGFTVSLSAPAPAPVTFDIATQDNSATTADNDYFASSLTGQTIAAGQQTFQFNVTINGDLNIEPNETFLVNVTNVINATVADGQGQGTIQNDDTPVLNINDVSMAEGDSGTNSFTFTVTSTLPAPAGGITFDIATADDSANAASDYVARSLTNQTIAAGNTTFSFEVTVNRDTVVEPNETFFVNITNPHNAAIGDGQGLGTIENDDAANLVISQVYGGGNNAGATYQNDFVEIFNRGTTTVDFALTPYSVQYAGVGSNFGSNKTNLATGSIAPGRYFLVQGSGGTTNGVPLPTADAAGSINLGSTAGKVALVAGTTALAASTCPGDDSASPFNANDPRLADLFGYGSTAMTTGHCYEGAAPAGALNNTTADFRRAGGCTDTNDSSADAFTSTPFPRNSSSPANTCAGFTPSLSINDLSVTEGNSGTTTVTFTVNLSAPAQGADVTFDIATADGSAMAANNDYVARSLTNQIIPAGQNIYRFTVTINGDTSVEPDEVFFVNVTNVTGASVTGGQATATIQHDDLPALSIDDVSSTEGDSGTKTFSFHVSLSAAAPATVIFDIATADNTATTADNDYVPHSLATETIVQGSMSYAFDVTVNGDQEIEASETFLVNVRNVSGATVVDGQGQGTIQNDDSPILSINSFSKAEGNSGTTIFTFTVTSTLPAPAGGITFDIATANNTAASASGDYVGKNVTGATIPQGQTTYNFEVTVNGDTSPELDETFFVNISNPSSGADISGSQSVGTIQNDDGPIIVISQIYPGGGLTNATYTNDFVEVFNRSEAPINFSVTPYSIQFLSTAGSTWTRTDLTSGTIAPKAYFLVKESGGVNGAPLPAPDATGSINLTSTTAGKIALVQGTTLLPGNCPGDDGSMPFNAANTDIVDFVGYGGSAATANHCYEGSGPAAFTLSNNTIAEFRKSGGCIDTNDNAADLVSATPMPRNSGSAPNDCSSGFRPDISIGDPAAITEGNGGTSTLNFTVTLSAPNNTQTVTVDFSTADGTATAGSDYQAASGTITFNPTETTRTIPISINGDLLDEPNETFFVILSNATNGVILDNRGLGTINDNDPAPSLSINDQANITEGDSGTSVINFTVTLSAASGQIVTVDFATVNATATAGSDYVATSGTLTFNPGDTTKTIPVTINGDTTDEADETFFVNLSNVSSTATISDSEGQGTIKNDDAGASADLSLIKTASSSTVLPGNNINYTITLQNSGPDISSGTTLSDTTPANTTFQSITPPAGWTCITPAVNGTGDISCSKASAFAVSTLSFSLMVKVNAGTSVGTQIINTAQVTSTTPDPVSTNDSATATVNVLAADSADLAVTNTDSPDPVAIGNNLNYTIVLTNNGPLVAASPSFVDNLPAAVNFRSLSVPAGWTCITPAIGGSGSISCSSGTAIGVNGTVTFALVVRVHTTVTDGTVISNTVNASTITTDSVLSNNSATAQTTAKAPQLVITQIYPGGGNSGATYTNDFIEIFNRGTTTVDFSLTNYSVQYESAGGANWSKTDITSGTLAPGQFFLIQEAGGANGVALPAPNATGSINLTASSAAKVALVAGTTLLTTACPGDDGTQPFNPNNTSIVDLVGYAGTATTGGHCYNGTGPAPFSTSTNPNARSTIRTATCAASTNNAGDFTNPTTAPVARNTATTMSPCP